MCPNRECFGPKVPSGDYFKAKVQNKKVGTWTLNPYKSIEP